MGVRHGRVRHTVGFVLRPAICKRQGRYHRNTDGSYGPGQACEGSAQDIRLPPPSSGNVSGPSLNDCNGVCGCVRDVTTIVPIAREAIKIAATNGVAIQRIVTPFRNCALIVLKEFALAVIMLAEGAEIYANG
jgi:hypothetical protein